jgi:hypothetical protein
MRLQKGQLWQCESRYCGSEFQVVASSEVECGINPRCTCGSMMRKIPVAPQVKPSPGCCGSVNGRAKSGRQRQVTAMGSSSVTETN